MPAAAASGREADPIQRRDATRRKRIQRGEKRFSEAMRSVIRSERGKNAKIAAVQRLGASPQRPRARIAPRTAVRSPKTALAAFAALRSWAGAARRKAERAIGYAGGWLVSGSPGRSSSIPSLAIDSARRKY